jgi:RNA polymerase sigma-70 factor, ECF subfamily
LRKFVFFKSLFFKEAPLLMRDSLMNSPSLHRGARAERRDRLDVAESTALSDENLMAELAAGCNDALAVLYDRYHRLVLAIALRIVRDPGEAEDVTQVVFLDIFRAVAQFDSSKGTTKVWILQYAYHRAINRRRQLNARSFYDSSNVVDIDAVLPNTQALYGGFAQAELKHLLQQALSTLSSSQKRVIELASYNGLSMKEIAEKTGDSLPNVRHYYYRGLQNLRSFVSGAQDAECA